MKLLHQPLAPHVRQGSALARLAIVLALAAAMPVQAQDTAVTEGPSRGAA